MTKNEKYTADGMVYYFDEFEMPTVLGRIAYIELSIEHPEKMLGISRVQSAILYDINDNELYDDQSVVDNAEYHSDRELVNALATHYSVDKDLIQII